MRLHPLAPLAAALLATLGCGSGHPELQRCAGPADCAADAFCRGGRCAASAPPVAVVTAPAARPLRSHTVLRFDGSLSHDPDPEDRVVAFAWTFRRAAAGCDPYPASSTGQAADVVFACAGSFEVELTVTDTTGRASAPSVLPITVELSADVPTVTMGPDVVAEHRCAGAPLRCGPELPAGAALSLSATAASPVSTTFTYAWDVALPPGLAGKPPPRITVDPPGGPAPTVTIETDGTAISGEYLFTVTVTDAYHLVAVGRQRVTLGNRPPAVSGGGTLPVAHSYDAAGSRFLASASIPSFTATDPDGDPLTSLGFTAAHAGDGGASFDLAASAWAASFTIAVPYAVPSDAANLIGGPGLSRTVSFAVEDPNGGRAGTSWDVVVTNRRPRLSGPLGTVSANHGFDAARGDYVAEAVLTGVVDDDGDPVVPVGGTGNAICPTLLPVAGAGPLTARCAMGYTGPGSLAAFVGSRVLSVQLADPFETLVAGSATIQILNRPPRVVSSTATVAGPCVRECCASDPSGCVEYVLAYQGGSASVPSGAVDDDGDPLELALASAGGATVPAAIFCATGTCPAVAATLASAPVACGPPPVESVTVTASDGIATGQGTLSLAPACR